MKKDITDKLDLSNNDDSKAFLKNYMNNLMDEETKEIISNLADMVKNKVKDITADTQLLRSFANSINNMCYVSEEIARYSSIEDYLKSLEPELSEELNKDIYNGLTIKELLNEPITSEANLIDAVESVRDYRRLKKIVETIGKDRINRELEKTDIYGHWTIDELLECYEKESIEERKENILLKILENVEPIPKITITHKGTKKIEYPTDKVNANIWTSEESKLIIGLENEKSKKQAEVIYSIDFDALEQETGVMITKKLTAFDKRCYIATSALFNEGFNPMTVAQIYATMGNIGRPNATDIKKINDSLTKMHAAHIYLNNESEHDLYPKFEHFIYDASLLPMERISAIANGRMADSAIHLFREPPLVSFAKNRKQITTFKKPHLLESPLSKTESNLRLEDYLLRRITFIKQGTDNKMLYSTIFKEAGITTKMQRNRAKEKISKYLEHYKKCEFIKSYEITEDGILIYYEKK